MAGVGNHGLCYGSHTEVSISLITEHPQAVRSFDNEFRARLLQFVTGTSRVPMNGFRELQGQLKFIILRDMFLYVKFLLGICSFD